MRVRVAAPTAAATERRQDLRVPASVEDAALRSNADQQHAFGVNSLEIGEEPGFASFGGEVTALDQPGEFFPAAQVENLGFRGEFAVVMNADGKTID